jgi:hypothetical protein
VAAGGEPVVPGVPAGTLHCFQLGAGGAEALSITSRAGASAMFTQFDAEISPDAPDLGKLVSIALTHGLEVGPPPDVAAG